MSSHHLVWVVLMASTGADVWVRGQPHRSHSGTQGAGALRSNPKGQDMGLTAGPAVLSFLAGDRETLIRHAFQCYRWQQRGKLPGGDVCSESPCMPVRGARAVTPGQPDASDCLGCATQGRADRAHTPQDRAIARRRALSQAGHQLAELVPAAHQAFGPALGGLPPLPQRCHLCRVCGVGRGMDGRLRCGAARRATRALTGRS